MAVVSASVKVEVPDTVLNRRRRLSPEERATRSKFLDFWDLVKPEISFLVALSAFAGFLLGSPGALDLSLLGATLLGVTLCAGGSGALNHFLERQVDARMRRTQNRPLPAGRLRPVVVLALGVLLIGAGLAVTYLYINTLTAGLAAVTVATYLFVYTPLKRITSYNTLVGCLPGALPALGGWTAATGEVGLGGWLLFALLFFWQIPHFLSLAWMYRKDYARGQLAMLPVVAPDGQSTTTQIILFTGLLVLTSVLLFTFDFAGWLYLTGIAVLGFWFIQTTFRFRLSRSNPDARKVLKASIAYIPAFVFLLVLDRFVGF